MIEKFAMQEAKKDIQPSIADLTLSLDDYPKTLEDRECMNNVPYASIMGSLMHAMLCTYPDICYAVGIMN